MLISKLLRDHFDLHNQYVPHKSYPPYNIIKEDDENFVIEFAVAGFEKDNFSVEVLGGNLMVHGASSITKEGEKEPEYLHKGISSKSFSLKFKLTDHVEVQSAKYDNGMLRVKLKRNIPEVEKPRQLMIEG